MPCMLIALSRHCLAHWLLEVRQAHEAQSFHCSTILDPPIAGHDPGVITYASPAAKKQARPQLPCYVPPEPDMQQTDSSAATFASQGARYAERIPAVL